MKILKNIIYHLFLSLRGLFFSIFNIIAGLFGLCILGFLAIYLFSGRETFSLKGFGISLFVFLFIYFVKHFYDKIIFWAKPDDIDLTLFK
ncbi:MAG: hypothetical protein SOY60_05035 [Fusobacterium gastrosuis]|uniref:hypothetical protein n=1 Tax=Fusobacterium gastrosuis TaxID=1755100 RepID=UPI002979EDC1|nr:hypothetical protein [Fusobacteriaceae bacterium]MDY4011010.1 hypothetical protein [Fusobacterium gastrosuis]MDY5713538.1 hypothetical protein [Fusobacterium gastrosuis]